MKIFEFLIKINYIEINNFCFSQVIEICLIIHLFEIISSISIVQLNECLQLLWKKISKIRKFIEVIFSSKIQFFCLLIHCAIKTITFNFHIVKSSTLFANVHITTLRNMTISYESLIWREIVTNVKRIANVTLHIVFASLCDLMHREVRNWISLFEIVRARYWSNLWDKSWRIATTSKMFNNCSTWCEYWVENSMIVVDIWYTNWKTFVKT